MEDGGSETALIVMGLHLSAMTASAAISAAASSSIGKLLALRAVIPSATGARHSGQPLVCSADRQRTTQPRQKTCPQPSALGCAGHLTGSRRADMQTEHSRWLAPSKPAARDVCKLQFHVSCDL